MLRQRLIQKLLLRTLRYEAKNIRYLLRLLDSFAANRSEIAYSTAKLNLSGSGRDLNLRKESSDSANNPKIVIFYQTNGMFTNVKV